MPQEKPPEFDVFLSHNSKDKPTVRRLGKALKDRGLRPWLDEWELPPGRPWQMLVEEIIQTVRSAAVLIGKDGLGPWEEPEMRACLTQFVKRKLPVIPVLLPGAPVKPELPALLAEFTWVDLRKGIRKQGLDRLSWGITGGKPADEPPAGEPPPGDDPVGGRRTLPPEKPGTGPPSDASEPDPQDAAGIDATEPRKKPLWIRLSPPVAFAVAVLTIVSLGLDLPGKVRQFRQGLRGTQVEKQILTGEILDAETGRPLAGATVVLPEYNLRGTTDDLGVYRFEVEAAKSVRVKLRATLEGYLDVNVDPMLGTGQLDTHRMWKEE